MVHYKNRIILAAVVLTLIAFIPSAQAEPPLKEGNPGLPRCLAKVNQLEQIIDAMKNYAPLPQTGQTYSDEAVGRDDGALRMGVKWPVPRFTDNKDGTVTDNLTKLVWPKNADCIANVTWYDALIYSNTLKNGSCGLSDNSVEGDWRLPNRNELLSLIDINYPSWGYYPLPEGHPFINVREDYYWTSSTSGYNFGAAAWYLHMGDGGMYYDSKNSWELYHVWPVRSSK